MNYSASSDVVESGAGESEVTEDLVVPQRNRPWKYIPQFSDDECRLLRVEDHKEDLGTEEGEGRTGDGLLQYYRHNRSLGTAADRPDEEEDLNGDLEVVQLAQVVYGRAPHESQSMDLGVHEEPIVPVRIERRAQMAGSWLEEEEERPRGNGLTSGGPLGTEGALEEPLIEETEQVQWKSYSGAQYSYQAAEDDIPEAARSPSNFESLRLNDDESRDLTQSHDAEKEDALWDEIRKQVAVSMETAATLSTRSASKPWEGDWEFEAEPGQKEVTLESNISVPTEPAVNQQTLSDTWPVSSAKAGKYESEPQNQQEEEEIAEEPIVKVKVTSQTCGVPMFSQELDEGHRPDEPELEYRRQEDLPKAPPRDRMIIETQTVVHKPEVAARDLEISTGSSQERPALDTRGRSREPVHQGGTLPPSGSKKSEKVTRARRSKSESFFGFLRRKSKTKEPEDDSKEEEERGNSPGGGKDEGAGDQAKSGSAKTTPTSSRTKDARAESEVKVKKSKVQGASFFEKLGIGRTSKKSDKAKQSKGPDEKKREAEKEEDKEKEERSKAEEIQKQSSTGSKTNIRIFEILAKNQEGEEASAGAGIQPKDAEGSRQHRQEEVVRTQTAETTPGSEPATLGHTESYRVQRPYAAAAEVDAHSDDYLMVGATLKRSSAAAVAAETGATSNPLDVRRKYIVAVAIDFGTAFSGYAFCFLRDPDSIHMMGRWEDGDPGVINQKTPTTLLLTPQGQFHSFGFTARNNYHDLSAEESKDWLYFDRFKMALYETQDCSERMTIEAANGKRFSGVDAISMTLRFFRDHALEQISSQSETRILNDDVLWVVTVPAIWNASAKQLMRIAAYKAELASPDRPDQLLVALEPEAASVHIRRLQLRHLVPEKTIIRPLSVRVDDRVDPSSLEFLAAQFNHVVRYMVVDCGGGTVDITVHELNSMNHRLQELQVASGGPYGSFAIDRDFESLLGKIFGADFIASYRRERPSGWVGLMMAFESRKRAADPRRTSPLNIALPFSFIDYYRKTKGSTVDEAIRGYGDSGVRWSSQGMLRLTQDAMKKLFRPTVDAIIQTVENVLSTVKGIDYIFLVGGLSESGVIQCDLRERFKDRVRKVVIPQEANLAVIKGAVVFGLDPAIISVRRSKLTYGAAVLNRFIRGRHPDSKLVLKDGVEWCRDVFDIFVSAGQVVRAGETVVRQYIPAAATQSRIVIGIFCTEHPSTGFVSDPGVRKCANVSLDLGSVTASGYAPPSSVPLQQTTTTQRRRIEASLVFAETEIKVTATDTTTGKQVNASIDFLNV